MKEQISQIKNTVEELLKTATNIEQLEDIRIKYLGKKGELTGILKGMGKLTAEERPIIGALANEVREFLTEEIDTKKAEISKAMLCARLVEEKIDITMPGKKAELGNLHPLTKVLTQFKETVIGMGFNIAEGPDVETDYYNFEALNIPKNHPARDTQDSFYVEDSIVLRTQTSPM